MPHQTQNVCCPCEPRVPGISSVVRLSNQIRPNQTTFLAIQPQNIHHASKPRIFPMSPNKTMPNPIFRICEIDTCLRLAILSHFDSRENRGRPLTKT
jgi:hypothetical protein